MTSGTDRSRMRLAAIVCLLSLPLLYLAYGEETGPSRQSIEISRVEDEEPPAICRLAQLSRGASLGSTTAPGDAVACPEEATADERPAEDTARLVLRYFDVGDLVGITLAISGYEPPGAMPEVPDDSPLPSGSPPSDEPSDATLARAPSHPRFADTAALIETITTRFDRSWDGRRRGIWAQGSTGVIVRQSPDVQEEIAYWLGLERSKD